MSAIGRILSPMNKGAGVKYGLVDPFTAVTTREAVRETSRWTQDRTYSVPNPAAGAVQAAPDTRLKRRTSLLG